MEEFLTSPVPYISGILRTQLDKMCDNNYDVVSQIEEEALIVNLDSIEFQAQIQWKKQEE